VYCTSRRCLLIIGIIGLLYSPLPAEGRRVGVLYEQAVCINNWNYWSLVLAPPCGGASCRSTVRAGGVY
jgi:hypothetical protein